MKRIRFCLPTQFRVRDSVTGKPIYRLMMNIRTIANLKKFPLSMELYDRWGTYMGTLGECLDTLREMRITVDSYKVRSVCIVPFVYVPVLEMRDSNDSDFV